jgi:hypothetical protein
VNFVRELVESLDFDSLVVVMKDYEELEETGRLADGSGLRLLAENLRDKAQGTQPVSTWFEPVIKEVYRVFAYRYIDLLD